MSIRPLKWTLRDRLLLIAGVGILPVAIAAGISFWILLQGHLSDVNAKSLEVTRVAAAAVEVELDRSLTGLAGLSVSPLLDQGQLHDFEGLLGRFLAQIPGWRSIALLSPDGQVLVRTDTPATMSTSFNLDAARRLDVAVGDLFRDTGGVWGVPITLPVRRDGTVVYVLQAILSPDSLVRIVETQGLPENWTMSVFDAHGARVARSKRHAETLGTPAAQTLKALLDQGKPSGTGVTHTLEGTEVSTAYVRLKNSGWAVALGIPTTSILAGAVSALSLYGVGILGSLVLAVLAAAYAARGINAPIQQLRAAAEGMGRGESPPAPDTSIVEILELGHSMGAAAEKLRDLEGERGRVLSELYATRDDLEAQVSDLQRLHRLTNELVLERSDDEQMQLLLAALCELAEGHKALLTLVDPDSGELRVRAARGLSEETVAVLRKGIPGRSTCARALVERRRVIIEDMQADPDLSDFRGLASSENVRGVHSLPVSSASARILGVVSVYRQTAGLPSARAMRLADLCARLAAVVIERTLAEADASESGRRLHVALESSAIPFSILDPVRDLQGVIVDFTWTYLNRAAAQDAGRPVDALQGRRIGDVAPRLWKIPGLFDTFVLVSLRGEAREFEVHTAASEPQERWLHVLASPFDGRVAVWTADISARVMQERALQAADQRKDEFLAVLAHELRNPLAPIQHAAVIAGLAGATDAQQRWSREIIERQVRQMALLLDDLLDVSRITRGKLELRRSTIELKAVIDAAVETARPHIDSRQHQLRLHLPESPVQIDADPLRLAQVLTNLLVNAARYTDTGGAISLTAGLESGGDVFVEVHDTGVGIAHEDLERIFEMFTQGTRRGGRDGGGLGIGLALARGIARLHGGSLTASSAGPGQGSSFRLVLPGSHVGTSSDGVEELSVATHQRPLNVLVADDNRDAADAVATLLRLAGHSVRVEYDGTAAIDAFVLRPAEVVLLDIGMPGLSGYDVARRIRGISITPGTPLIVAMSGWGQPRDKDASVAAGFDHHLTKPVAARDLIELLARWSDR